MIDLSLYKFRISGLYAAYCASIMWYIDPFTMLGYKPHWMVSVAILAAIFGIVLLTLMVANTIKNRGLKQLVVFLGFALSPAISAVGALIATNAEGLEKFYVIYGFTIISLPFLAFVILWIIYEDIKHKMATSDANPKNSVVTASILKIKSDKGKMMFQVDINTVLCFEANDNYVVVYHLDELNQTQKSMQRISLKKVEGLLKELSVEFKRVHKSYLINPTQIEKVDGKAQAYRVRLKHFDKDIPVSRNFKISDITG